MKKIIKKTVIKTDIEKIKLPSMVRVADLKPLKGGRDYTIGDSGNLLLYFVTGFGWCITTLLISNSKTGPSRYYAIKLDGTPVRIGNGPHVKKVITIHLGKINEERLKPLVDLYYLGLEKAGIARDRISTRRMRRSLY